MRTGRVARESGEPPALAAAYPACQADRRRALRAPVPRRRHDAERASLAGAFVSGKWAEQRRAAGIE